ncbi:MAG: MobA/MobL family protein [Terracidiphilus sp.]
MAIYHLNAKVGSRTSGQSAGAKHDYVCREGRYANGEARLAKRNEAELVYRNSGNMPQWAKNEPAMYWKAADLYERANGRLFQSVEIALPMELGKNEQIALAEKFASEIAKTKDGVLPYTLAVHRGKGENPHAHIIVSERVNDGHARTPETWFKRAAVSGKQTPERGGAKKTDAYQPKEWLDQVRTAWADRANKALAGAGIEKKIDSRSHAERRLVIRPTVHEGPNARAMAERGLPVERVKINDEIKAANQNLAALSRELAQVKAAIGRLTDAVGQIKNFLFEKAKKAGSYLMDPEPQPVPEVKLSEVELRDWVRGNISRYAFSWYNQEQRGDFTRLAKLEMDQSRQVTLEKYLQSQPERKLWQKAILTDPQEENKLEYATLKAAEPQRLAQIAELRRQYDQGMAEVRTAIQDQEHNRERERREQREAISVPLTREQAGRLIAAEYAADPKVQAVAGELIDVKKPIAVLEGRALVWYDNENRLLAQVRKDEKPDLERLLPELRPRQPQREQQRERWRESGGYER